MPSPTGTFDARRAADRTPSRLYSPADAAERRQRYLQLAQQLKKDRVSGFDADWRDLADYIAPRRVRFTTSDRNKGGRRDQKIVDSTARFSARTLQSGLHAGLTSPARPWMRLTTPDPDLAEVPNVKAWLHRVTQRMLTVFLQSNLYNTLPIVYGDMGVFGTAAMAVVTDTHDLMRCYAYPLGSFALGLDRRRLVTSFALEYQLTVRQIVESFGLEDDGRTIDWSRISTGVRQQWDRGNYESAIEVTWVTTPNLDARPDRPEARYFKWASCHFETGGETEKILRESGFKTFPILAPRWDITGEDTYGTDCPGMTAIGDVRQLQTMQRKKATAIQKIIDPPLVGPEALRTQKTSLLPGDITYVDEREGSAKLRAIHEVNLNLQHLRADIGETQYRIQRAFYEDLFLMLAQRDAQGSLQPVTAREVEERHEEKLLALGPVLERTNDELLDPLVDRVYQLMEDAGLIPEVPQELDGVTLKVEYTSLMAQAQRLVGVVGQDRFLSTVLPLAQTFPEVRHKVQIFQAVNDYADMLGIDPRIVVSDEDAKAALAAERQQQQQFAEAQQAALLARGARDAAAAPLGTTEDNALSRLVDNVAGAAT